MQDGEFYVATNRIMLYYRGPDSPELGYVSRYYDKYFPARGKLVIVLEFPTYNANCSKVIDNV